MSSSNDEGSFVNIDRLRTSSGGESLEINDGASSPSPGKAAAALRVRTTAPGADVTEQVKLEDAEQQMRQQQHPQDAYPGAMNAALRIDKKLQQQRQRAHAAEAKLEKCRAKKQKVGAELLRLRECIQTLSEACAFAKREHFRPLQVVIEEAAELEAQLVQLHESSQKAECALAAAQKKIKEYEIRKQSLLKRGKEDKKESIGEVEKTLAEKKTDEALEPVIGKARKLSIKEANRASFNEYLQGLFKHSEIIRMRERTAFILFLIHMFFSLVAGPSQIARCLSAFVSFLGMLKIAHSEGLTLRTLLTMLVFVGDIYIVLAITYVEGKILLKFACITLFTIALYILDSRQQSFVCALAARASIAGDTEAEVTANDANKGASEPSEDTPVDPSGYRSIQLPSNKLGLVLLSEWQKPAIVYHIIPNESADRQGQLRRGDVIERINGMSVKSDRTAEHLMHLVHQLEGPITLKVRNDRKYLERAEKETIFDERATAIC